MDKAHGNLIIKDQMIYEHKTLQVNYTTYDNQHDQDTINPGQQSDVMVLADDDDKDSHPFWYFCIVKIFHTSVQFIGQNQPFEKMEFLWGRWYGVDDEIKSGFGHKWMYQIGFVAGDDAFGFISPGDVLCAVHLIPVFAGQHIEDLLGPSIAWCSEEANSDYEHYYVN
ncbi:hypothetical protein C0995_006165, partial [Termitomyces sp. Mi166